MATSATPFDDVFHILQRSKAVKALQKVQLSKNVA